MAKERRLYDAIEAAQWQPRKEWVEMTDGSWVCVWELSVSEAFRVAESAQRHPQDPRPGANEGEAATWLVALAARRDESPEAARVWGDMEVHRLLKINPADFSRLLTAARFMLQNSEEGEQATEDFTLPPPVSSGPN